MPQPNWQKLVTQGRAQAIGVPLSDTVTVTAPSASAPKELEPSPLTPEEKAFLESQEKEENEVKTPENDVPAPEATDNGGTIENAPIGEETGETEGNTEPSGETGPQKPEESTESNENTVPATTSEPSVVGTTPPENMPAVTVSGTEGPKAEEMSFAELKKALTDLGQTIPFGANKAKLVEMFNAIP